MNRNFTFSLAVLLTAAVAASSGCARPVASNPRISATNVQSLQKALGSGSEAGPAAAAAVVAEPTGWGTLKGKFVLSGEPPPRQPLAITKDVSVCAPGGKTVLDEDIVVDPATKGIKDIVIYLVTKYPANDPKWEHADYQANATGQTEIPFDQKDCVFLSHMFVMRSTQTLLIKNSDEVGHNTSINPSPGSKAQSFNQLIPNLGSLTYKPVGESSIPNAVSCSIHPWMSALLLTRNNPYFAVTRPDGSFEIKNVPTGVELEFAVWQQKSQFLSTVKVQEGEGAAKDETWKKGRFKRKLEDGGTVDLTVSVDAATFK